MLKLCLALPLYYPTFGGAPLRLLRSQPGLRKRDIEVRVLTGTARSKDDFHLHDAHDAHDELDWDAHPMGAMLPVEIVDETPVHRVRLPPVTGVKRTSAYFRALIALCRDPATRPDVIQLHSFERAESFFWLPRLRRLGIPTVHAIQIARPLRRRTRTGRRMERAFRKAFYERFDGILTNSDAIGETLREWAVRTPVDVIPNGVDLTRFRPVDDLAKRQRARRALGIEGPGPVVLSVGAICPRKGSDLLVAAWSRLLERHPTAELLFVGPRHDRNNPNLRSYARGLDEQIARARHPERIHRVGVRDDMNDVYAAADVVALPSSREGMPNAVIEAMACGRPVVLTPFLGQSKQLGRAGLEFRESERTPDALAAGLAALLEDTVAREDQIRNGRSWVRRHLDLDTNLDRLAEFYRRTSEDGWSRARVWTREHGPAESTPLRHGVEPS